MLAGDRRLQHDRSARPHHGQRGREAARRPGRVDDQFRADLRGAGRDAELSGTHELLRVMAGEHHPSPRDHQHLGHEQSELPVAEDDGAHPGRDHHLLQHLERGGQRLDEDRCRVGDPVRHAVQVASREHHLVGERAVGADDPEHASRRTVTREPGGARRTDAAGEVDLPDDARADEVGVRRRDHVAHPLVARRAAKAEVAARDLEIRAADAGAVDADDRLARRRHRVGEVACERQPDAVPAERSHAAASLSAGGLNGALWARGLDRVLHPLDGGLGPVGSVLGFRRGSLEAARGRFGALRRGLGALRRIRAR